jgi:hypothetical protein
MNCQRFEDVVSDIAREQIIDAAARAEALRHGEHCEYCAGRLDDERAITLNLRGLAENLETASAPSRVQAHLLAAFDELKIVHFPAHSGVTSRQRVPYLIGAIAAGLLIVFGLFAMRWSAPVRHVTQPPLVAATGSTPSTGITTPYAPPIIRQKPSGPVISNRKLSNRRKDATAKAQVAKAGNTEIATDFLPLTYGAGTNLEEGGRMVRVELPHSAMATFGLPVNMDRANERVKADVLFGVDGLAHAIRFVR